MSENEHDETMPEDEGPVEEAQTPETVATDVDAADDAVVDSADYAADAGHERGDSADAKDAEPELSQLMSSGQSPADTTERPDLDAEALRAAREAIAEGESALADARARLSSAVPEPRKGSKTRELVLRLLLAANVLAMVVVAMLPGPEAVTEPVTQPGPVSVAPTQPDVPPVAEPRLADKYNQALIASEGGDYAGAITLLESYLQESPRMQASRRVNVFRQMAHYASAIGQFTKAQDYERRAQMISKSHSLPEDLVAMAHAALENGDQESLRQVWARFLLQQRQVPSSLYQHVAEAYLQLGDSYRVQANDADESARLEELKKTEQLLREQAEARKD